MKKFLLAIFLLGSFSDLFAKHVIGGEMRYEYAGAGSTPNSKRYKISLLLFRGDDPTGAQLQGSYVVGIFNNDNNQKITGSAADNNWTIVQESPPGILAVPILISPCIQNAPTLNYTFATYSMIVELPNNNNGYTIDYQTCCRQNSIENVSNSVGVTYNCVIPGLNQLLTASTVDSSPKFGLPVSVICFNSAFSLDFSATDSDGDSLVYSLCDAYNGGSSINSAFTDMAPPPYGSVPYINGYSGSFPLGTQATINPATGIISGIAPAAGAYVVCVCIEVYRNGRNIASHRKDLIVKVSECSTASAQLNPGYKTCDGFTLTFSNTAPSNPSGTLFSWDFGDPASGIQNTSTLSTPTHTYTDTGIYKITLRASIAGLCTDSATSLVRVYPGFFPAFNANPPFCKGVPVSFTDQTSTRYGTVTGWRWDFGEGAISNDTSIVKNSFYTYNTAGPYTVTLIVGNTFGCVDTITRDIIIVDKPLLTVTSDTTYCALDSVKLTATAVGAAIFSWSPGTAIIGANTATPRVFPAVPTTYYVTLNQNGCIAKDSVTVTPVNNVTNAITASSTNICEDDTITLTGSSNYTNVSWQWTPVAKLLSPASIVTKAFPPVTTLYTLTTHWGRCVATATQNIIVKPLAIAEAGLPAAFCKGQGSAQLQASGGISYQWMPATGLSDPTIANPIATPSATTTYKVLVGVAGCTGKKADSVQVLVRALPALTLTNDTLICSIDTLKLKATGTGTFAWRPNYIISSLSSPTPLVSPDVPTKYFVTLTDAFGCVSNDSVFVDVKLFVTISAGNDTTICRTDGIFISTTSDALSYKWTPSTYLNSDTAKRPFAIPLDPQITYNVVGNIGKCQSNSHVKISTVPYPVPYAGNDTTVCFGSSVPLLATGGSSYTWLPPTFLSATNIPNPTSVKPTDSVTYIVSVTDVLGCPKPAKDSVRINVYPKIRASTGIRDTSIVVGQTIQLNGSGGRAGDIYLWTPSSGLSNPNIARPIASPEDDSIEYKLFVTTVPEGCTGRDSVKIKVFKLPPSFYVPTAFSPNGDGKNDILYPIALGMKAITYFKVYNRFGQLVFSTTERGKGWDGVFKGNPQDPATYVWIAQGETYKGEFITRKGYAVLIR